MPIVYVYSICASAKELEEKAIQLGESIFWTADLSNFQMGKGIPLDWSDQGSIFSQMGELRWKRAGEKYQALEEEVVFLQDLSEPKVRPSFEEYPHGDVAGLLKVKTCKRDGVIVSISPREILPRRRPNES
jgi:hypothetical protein